MNGALQELHEKDMVRRRGRRWSARERRAEMPDPRSPRVGERRRDAVAAQGTYAPPPGLR